MSNSRQPPSPSRNTPSTSVPRAVIHKKILDAGTDQPEASMEKLADEVSGASVELVKQVLKEYGDPAADDQAGEASKSTANGDDETTHDTPIESMATESEHAGFDISSDHVELTEKQHETLRAIYDHPEATQADLADILDVSSATINNRVNTIPGFEWENREELVEPMFENETPQTDDVEPSERNNGELSTQMANLEQQIASVEQQLDTRATNSASVFTDPDLLHKVIHACMTSDQISEDEELRILQHLVG